MFSLNILQIERKSCEERLQGAIASEQEKLNSEMETFKVNLAHLKI